MTRLAPFAALAACLTLAPARANFIVNGGFESPGVGSGIASITPGNEPAGFGFRVLTGDVEVQGQTYFNLPGPAFEGTQFLDLNGISVGGLSQTFATTPGTGYMLSFAYANNYAHTGPGNPATSTVSLSDASSPANLVSPFTISHGTSTAANLDWTVLTVGFTAASGQTTLGFASTAPTPFGGILLDGVSVEAAPVAAVPAPGGLVLVAGSLAVAMAARRRPAN